MAEVKTTEYIEKMFPSWNQGQTYVYNNELYVVTTTTIYKYNLQLDVYETVYTRSETAEQAFSWKKDNVIYMYHKWNGSYLKFDKYDLSTRTFTANALSYYYTNQQFTMYALFAIDDILYMSLRYYYNNKYRYYTYKFQINYNTDTITRIYTHEEYTSTEDSGGIAAYVFFMHNSTLYVVGTRYGANNILYIGSVNQSTGNVTHIGNIPNNYSYTGTSYAKDNVEYIFMSNKQYTFNFITNAFTLADERTPFGISSQNIFEYGASYMIMNSTGYYRISYNTYELTYTIKNNDGTETYDTVTDAAPITKVEFVHDRQNNIVAYSLTTLAGVITGTYTPQLPMGKTLAGYTTTQGGQTVQIPLANEISTSITADTVFYEVYKKYVPPMTTFNVELYQNTADKLVLDKTSFLTLIDTLSGALRDRCDIINPTIVIEYNAIPDFNYVHIPIWNRYYYVDKIVSVRIGLWEISLTLDERFSYKDGILGLKNVLIARAESATWYNPYLVDELIPTEAGTVRTVTEIPNTSLPAGDPMYPFVVAVVAIGST